MFTTENLVWAFFFAVIVAVIYAFAMQYSLSVLAKRLIDGGADSAENAKTLKELGYKNAFAATLAGFFAGSGTTVSRAIEKIGGEKNPETDKELLFSEKEPVKYYIPEENITKNVKKHVYEHISPVKMAVLLLLLLIAAYAASSVIDFLGNYAYSLVDGGSVNAPVGVENDDSSLLEDQKELNRREEEMKMLEEELKAEIEAEKEEVGKNPDTDVQIGEDSGNGETEETVQ